jgi:hypothetical protein
VDGHDVWGFVVGWVGLEDLERLKHRAGLGEQAMTDGETEEILEK